MNTMNEYTNQSAQRQAILNTYSYIANKYGSSNGESFSDIIDGLRGKQNSNEWKENDIQQLNVLVKALENDPSLGNLQIGNQANEQDGTGMNACTFVEPGTSNVYVVFRGTGNGEWIDNGEGLSGIPEKNTYYEYNKNGQIPGSDKIVNNDYASDQQARALNWFNEVCAKNGWNSETNITVSGHSKGGNKAQYVTINSDLVDECYSFDGQGFSPEAINQFKDNCGTEYESRRNKIHSISAENDYVNVLGERLAPESQVYYIEAPMGDRNLMDNHQMHAMLNEDGKLNQETNQGDISKYLEHLSHDIMKLEPELRKHATEGLMAILQNMFGNGATPVNGDAVSFFEVLSGLIITIPLLISHKEDLRNFLIELVKLNKDQIIDAIEKKLSEILFKYGPKVLIAYVTVIVVSTIFIIFVIDQIMNFISMVNEMIVFLDSIIKYVKQSIEIFCQVYSVLKDLVDSINEWYNKNFNEGYKYATANPMIQINTGLLYQYADRLQNITHQINNIDHQINALYSKVKITDLFRLLQADLMIGNNWKINNCIRYLNETASDFENVERNICAQL